MTDKHKAFMILAGWVLGHSWHCIEYSIENWQRLCLLATKLQESEIDYSQTAKHYIIHVCMEKKCLEFLSLEEVEEKSGISHGWCKPCAEKFEQNNKKYLVE